MEQRADIIFAAALLALSSFTYASAGQFEDGRSAFQTGDYLTAFRLLLPLAEQGNDAAQMAIATLYNGGMGLPQDDKQAAVWYQKAANQGNVLAQLAVGLLYHVGYGGVPKDDKQAVIWFRRAAEQGNAVAQAALGDEYHQGLGVSRDYTLAVAWFRKAAEQGDINAQYNLGVSFAEGRGIPQDFVQAHMWFNLAASRAEVEIGRKAARNRDFLAARMTPVQLAEAQRLASERTPK
jgi:uncharacterized protein